MKKVFIPCLFFVFNFCFFLFHCSAQTVPPQKINYQAVARDASGNPMAIATVSVSFDIHQSALNGPVVYSESHTLTTNQFGLFTAVIGQGTTADDFTAINWSADAFFLEVTVNGNNMGTTQFLSVPYAMHAHTADSISNPGMRPWTKSADSLHTTFLNDKVGIGTVSPKEKLHIVEPAGFMNPHVLLESTGGSFDIGYKIKTAGGSNEWLIGKDNGEFDVLKLKWKSGLSSFTGFSMLSSGRVGIGLASPLELFHIKDSEIPANAIDDDLDGMTDETDGIFAFTKSGKVGIGTLVPGARLDVLGNVKIADGTQGVGKILTSDAAGVGSWQPSPMPGFSNVQTYTATGTYTFTTAPGVTKVLVEVWGGGGGGGGNSGGANCGGGGGGGYGKSILTVTPSTNYIVVVGALGAGGAAGGAGAVGGTSSFGGAMISATGGSGGSATTGTGGVGGTSAASFNISGEAGRYGLAGTGPPYGGAAGQGGFGGLGGINSAGGAGSAPGGGGGGANGAASNLGGNGAVGRVVVWW